MNGRPSLTVLQEIYLEELKVLHRIKVGCRFSDEMVARASEAEKRVHAAFAMLGSSGGLRELGRAYRAARLEKKAKGETIIPWPAYIQDEMRRMMRAMAIEQRSRARRGVQP